MHLSALSGLIMGLPFVAPLVIHLLKRSDPDVRPHSAAAVNFNISVLIYGAAIMFVGALAGGIYTMVVLVLPVMILAWIVVVLIVAARAGRGHDPHYLIAMPFVR